MNEVVLLQSAQADLLEIFGLYGEASYRRIDAALESIRKMPELAPIYHDHFRRKLVEGTPYGVFYSVVGSRLMISFILDLRQDPSTIEQRCDGGGLRRCFVGYIVFLCFIACEYGTASCGSDNEPEPHSTETDESTLILPPELSRFQNDEDYHKLDRAGGLRAVQRYKPISIPPTAEFLGGVVETELDAVCYRMSSADATAFFAGLSGDWTPIEMRNGSHHTLNLTEAERAHHMHFTADVAFHHYVELKYNEDTNVQCPALFICLPSTHHKGRAQGRGRVAGSAHRIGSALACSPFALLALWFGWI